MTAFLYALVALISAVSFNFVSQSSSFRERMLAYNRGSFAYRNAMNGAQLAMSELDRLNASVGINSSGMVTALLCAAKDGMGNPVRPSSCEDLKMWGKDNVTNSYLATIKTFVNPSSPKKYTSTDGSQYEVFLIPETSDSKIGVVNFRVGTNIAGKKEMMDVEILFPQVKGNGLSNAIASDHVKCLFCHVTVFGNVAAYASSEIHNPMTSRIHGKLIFAKAAETPPTDSANGSVMAPSPWRDGGTWGWAKRGLDTYTLRFNPVGWGANESALPTATYPRGAGDNVIYDMQSPHAMTSMAAVLASQPTYPFSENLFARDIITSPTSSELPYNLKRQNISLPKISPDFARSQAKGRVAAPLTGLHRAATTYDKGTFLGAPRSFENIIPGDALLKGTASEPITITGSIYVDGDLIISGYVSGQGAITARGNIYIIEDIIYKNPPGLFDGSQTSNQEMSTASRDTASAMATAKKMRDADRLMLFAGKSTVIGSPFQHNNYMNFDAKYAQTALLSTYNLRYGYETATGTLYDVVSLNNNGTPVECYLKPWESIQNCRTTLPSGVTSLSYNRTRGPLESNESWVKYFRGYDETDIYKALFHPTLSWINKDEFFDLVKNDAAVQSSYNWHSVQGKERVLAMTMWPKLDYGIGAASVDDFKNVIENATGLISAGDGFSSDQIFGYPANYKLSNAITDFLTTCHNFIHAAPGTGYRGPGNEILNNFLNFNVDQSLTMTPNPGSFITPDGDAVKVAGMNCRFYYSASKQISQAFIYMDGLGPEKSANGKTFRYYMGRDICSDQGAWNATTSPNFDNTSVQEVKPCLKYIPDSVKTSSFVSNVVSQPSVQIVLSPLDQRIKISTNIWQDSKIKFIPRTHMIEAFLFANEFILKNQPYVADAQLRLHGGFVAKELVGLFNSPPGIRAVNNTVNGNFVDGHDHENASGLWLVHDPRFMFVEDVPTGVKYIINGQ